MIKKIEISLVSLTIITVILHLSFASLELGPLLTASTISLAFFYAMFGIALHFNKEYDNNLSWLANIKNHSISKQLKKRYLIASKKFPIELAFTTSISHSIACIAFIAKIQTWKIAATLTAIGLYSFVFTIAVSLFMFLRTKKAFLQKNPQSISSNSLYPLGTTHIAHQCTS